jgi:hypothetical protein
MEFVRVNELAPANAYERIGQTFLDRRTLHPSQLMRTRHRYTGITGAGHIGQRDQDWPHSQDSAIG